MQTGRSLESSQIQDCSSGKLSKAFHTSTATVTAVRRELCFRKAKNHNWASVSEPHTCDLNATFPLCCIYIPYTLKFSRGQYFADWLKKLNFRGNLISRKRAPLLNSNAHRELGTACTGRRLGMRLLCRHSFGHNRHVHGAGIMRE